jgi:hypothetical protein
MLSEAELGDAARGGGFDVAVDPTGRVDTRWRRIGPRLVRVEMKVVVGQGQSTCTTSVDLHHGQVLGSRRPLESPV